MSEPDGAQRDARRQLTVLAFLTFATGLVDAASVLGLGHVFTANMTGNVVFLGFSLAGQGAVSAPACAVALGAFLVGALAGGRLAASGAPFKRTIVIEAACIAGAATVAWVTDDVSARLVEIAFLGAGMGLQNAAVRKLGVADMTTTVLTLTLTGLAADSSLAGGTNPRWIRRLTSVAVMLLGALTGALLVAQGVRWAITGAGLIVAVACAAAPSAGVQSDRTPGEGASRPRPEVGR